MSALPAVQLKNGFSLPKLGLGTWLMGGDAKADAAADIAREVAAIETALQLGIRHIDTAEMYGAGVTETIVGKAIAGHKRDELFLASKVMKHNQHYDDLLRALDGSLQRMGTDYLDLYYLHAASLDTPLEETAKALNKAYADKKIRAVAVANFMPERLDRLQSFLEAPIVANQVHYNLSFRQPDTVDMFTHAQARDYLVVAWRPIKLKNRNIDPSQAQKNPWERGAYPLLDEISDRTGHSNVQIALAWVLGHANTVTLVKSSNPAHLQEIVDAVAVNLSVDDFAKLTKEFQPITYVSDSVPLA